VLRQGRIEEFISALGKLPPFQSHTLLNQLLSGKAAVLLWVLVVEQVDDHIESYDKVFIINNLNAVLETNKCATGEGDLHLLPICETACPKAPVSHPATGFRSFFHPAPSQDRKVIGEMLLFQYLMAIFRRVEAR
jgi:hypothetical protein